jgi:hypothetical protein
LTFMKSKSCGDHISMGLAQEEDTLKFSGSPNSMP